MSRDMLRSLSIANRMYSGVHRLGVGGRTSTLDCAHRCCVERLGPRVCSNPWMEIRGMASMVGIHHQGLSTESDHKAQYGSSFKGLLPVCMRIRGDVPFYSMGSFWVKRSFSSHSGSFGSGSKGQGTVSVFSPSEPNASDVGSDLVGKAKAVWQSTADAVTSTGEKAKEASQELSPYIQQLLDSPYLKDINVPFVSAFVGTGLAWFWLPWILKRFHAFTMQSKINAAKLYGSIEPQQIPYEKSVWGAMEDPVRYFVTITFLSQIGLMLAPNVIAPETIPQAMKSLVIISFSWFLYRLKTNFFSGGRPFASSTRLAAYQWQTLDKVSSVGIVVIGAMALAEAFGVSVQSILTVGGVGGVATAFASRDILSNFFSGLMMQFSKPFSIGDIIKAGSVEGKVTEMGLTSTSLLTVEKYPITVPNSLFSSQAIINKSQAEWRVVVTNIAMMIDDPDKIRVISEAIKSMLKEDQDVDKIPTETEAAKTVPKENQDVDKVPVLKRNQDVSSSGHEAPYCYLSHIESSYAELTMGYNLKKMGKEKFYTRQEDIMLKCVSIIKQHGGSLADIPK